MVPQVQATLGGGQCATLQELLPGRKALHNQFFLFSKCDHFVLQSVLFDLDSVKCGIFYVPPFLCSPQNI